VADLVIHSRDADLIAGTHGRGIYILDIWPLQQLSMEAVKSDYALFNIEPAALYHLDITKNKGASGARRFAARNPFADLFDMDAARYVLGLGSELAPPGAAIYYYLKSGQTASVEIAILDQDGRLVRRLEGPARAGINCISWDLRESPQPIKLDPSGNDAVRLSVRGISERPGPLVKPGPYKVQLKVGEDILERELIIEPDVFLDY
jgi:hypothetical protein